MPEAPTLKNTVSDVVSDILVLIHTTSLLGGTSLVLTDSTDEAFLARAKNDSNSVQTIPTGHLREWADYAVANADDLLSRGIRVGALTSKNSAMSIIDWGAGTLETPIPSHSQADPRAMGISSIDYCAMLTVQRHTVDAAGRVLFLPGTGITVVPYEMGQMGGWYCVVAEDSEHYKRGGHPLWIPCREIETGIERVFAPVDRTSLGGN